MNQAFQALWAFMFMLLLFVLVLATAKSNGLIVWGGPPYDLAAVLLAAVALVVTCLGVFIAILALWGYKEIRDKAIEQAVAVAVEKAVAAARDAAKPVAARTALEYAKSQNEDWGEELTDAQVEEIAKAVGETNGD